MKIGIDLGGSHIGVGLIDRHGKLIIKKDTEITEDDKQDIENVIINTMVNFIEEILEVEQLNSDLECIGISSPGTISNGHILNAHNLCIKDFNIIEALKQYFNIPIKLRNDAKCAGIAEKHYGSLKDCSDAVFLTIGTGIGGACFLDNKLLESKRYSGFEVGHVILKEGGKKCSCGNLGCFEAYASMRVLRKNVKKALGIKEDLTGKELNKLINGKEHKEELEPIIDEYIKYLGIGISNYINIFEPEKVSLGGSFVYHKNLYAKLKKNISTFNEFDVDNIVLAELKNDAGIIGSVL